jgi:hypothetical protein
VFISGLISLGDPSPLRETAGALDAFNLPLVSVISSHGGGGGREGGGGNAGRKEQ